MVDSSVLDAATRGRPADQIDSGQPSQNQSPRTQRADGPPSPTAAVEKYRSTIAEDDARIAGLEERAAFPKLAGPPPPQAPTDPLQAFGQPAMWLGLFGSLMTRRPFTNAILAAGQVMESVKTQDAAAYKSAFESWKINSENALKLAQHEQKALEAAIRKKDTDVRGATAEFEVLTKAFGAGALQDIFQKEGWTGVEKYMLASKRRLGDAEVGAGNFKKEAERAAEIGGYLHSGDTALVKKGLLLWVDFHNEALVGKGLTAKDRAEARDLRVKAEGLAAELDSEDPVRVAKAMDTIGQMTGYGSLKTPKATPATVQNEERIARLADQELAAGKWPGETRDAVIAHIKARESGEKAGAAAQAKGGVLSNPDRQKLENHAARLTQNLDTVAELEAIAKRTPVVAGGFQRILKPTETVANILQFSNDTDRHKFDRLLAELKLRAPEDMKGANPTSRAIAGDAALVDRIIGGGNWGDTYQSFMSAMSDLRKVYQNEITLAADQYQRGTGQPLSVPGFKAPPVLKPFSTSAPKAGGNGAPPTFASEAEADAAAKAGKIQAGDKIIINGVRGTWH